MSLSVVMTVLVRSVMVLLGLCVMVLAVLYFWTSVANYRKARREELSEELAEVRHRWSVCLKENECARELNAKIVEGAVDRGSEDEQRRRQDRYELIAHNQRLIESMRLREVWIKKRLGI